jgi:NADPH:quinone reductase-like Zn-dependent oxidoreductase
MRAIVPESYGLPGRGDVHQVAVPEVEEGAVLVRVRAASVNPADWFELSGRPLIARPMMGWRRPKTKLAGHDFAGVVVAIGKDVTHLAPGDEVYGLARGSFAEYVAAKAGVARKPVNLTFEEAAAVPIAALTALQALRDHGDLQPGQSVLINGASGGVGTFAVQIAKALGAEVSAVCSTRNVEQTTALGAARVIDYSQEDFTRTGETYDLILDIAGTRSWSAYRRALKFSGRLVIVGGPKSNRLLGPLSHVLKMRLRSMFSGPKVVFFVAKPDPADLDVLREMLESATIRPVVEARYELTEVGEALRHLGTGHARGKIVVSVSMEP